MNESNKNPLSKAQLVYGPTVLLITFIVFNPLTNLLLGSLFDAGPMIYIVSLFFPVLASMLWFYQIKYIDEVLHHEKLIKYEKRLLKIAAIAIAVAGTLGILWAIQNLTYVPSTVTLAIVQAVFVVASITGTVMFMLSIYNASYISKATISSAMRVVGKIGYALFFPFLIISMFITYIITYMVVDPPDEG